MAFSNDSRRARLTPAPSLLYSALLAAFAAPANAQEPPAQTLPKVVVEGAATPRDERAAVGGLGDAPLAETPQSVSVLRSGQLRDAGAGSLSSAIRGEASASDFYNTIGYIESVQVRGFLLDERLNYRRDGLPVSNHMPVPLENKSRIEILQGTSGVQAGVSAPGGLVNYVLKRPTAVPLREVFFGLSERGTSLLAGDAGGRAGEGEIFGYRINAALENRRPEVRDATGNRQFASGFFDFRLPADVVVEAEVEWQKFRQPSVPGFGLLDTDGDGVAETLPPPIDPRLNLNNQPWSQPFESRSTIGSLRIRQALSPDWRWAVAYGEQHVRTNDRIAFPDGCSSGPNYVYPGLCGNYDVDFYDFRSENERRTMKALDAYLAGNVATGPVRHELKVGYARTRYAERFEPLQAYNFVGTGNVLNPVILPPDPTPSTLNTQSDDRRDEFYAQDVLRFGPAWSLWLGARHARIERESVRTDGTEAVSITQSFTTPFASLGWQPWPGGFAYLSGGSGVESELVPNRPSIFTNFGAALPALRSRQREIGFKQVLPEGGLASIVLFDIRKPYSDDVPQPDGRVTREAGAREARHRGAELAWTGKLAPSFLAQAQVTWLDARTTKSLDPATIDKRTPNTAPAAVSLAGAWQVPGISGLTWNNRAIWVGHKPVLRDNSVQLPTYWQWDSNLVLTQPAAGTLLTWRLGVDNVTDRSYWRDAPTQYWGGIYLFPAPPRTWRASVQASF